DDPQPTTPPGPFDPASMAGIYGNGLGNANIIDRFESSNFMQFNTDINSSLQMFGNRIQGNGTQNDLQSADGVFIRVGTNSYLAGDVRNNVISGNVSNDFRTESFDAYNPLNGFAPQPTGSVAKGPPDPDQLVIDDAALFDLRFTGNIGNTLSIQNPLPNFVL